MTIHLSSPEVSTSIHARDVNQSSFQDRIPWHRLIPPIKFGNSDLAASDYTERSRSSMNWKAIRFSFRCVFLFWFRREIELSCIRSSPFSLLMKSLIIEGETLNFHFCVISGFISGRDNFSNLYCILTEFYILILILMYSRS